jgi:CheY-like chemotaxis protein
MSTEIHILIVDDNPSMTKTLADILEAKGYAVHAAYSGKEALKILSKHSVDIMLTDVRMPDMNGVELYRKMRKKHSGVVTFLMTAYAADDIIQEGVKEGIRTVLTKPLDIDYLLMLFLAAISAYGRKS